MSNIPTSLIKIINIIRCR